MSGRRLVDVVFPGAAAAQGAPGTASGATGRASGGSGAGSAAAGAAGGAARAFHGRTAGPTVTTVGPYPDLDAHPRPIYREPRREIATRVYTVHDESRCAALDRGRAGHRRANPRPLASHRR